MTDTRKLARSVSGWIAFLAPTYFAWTVYAQHIPQNIATWTMITINNLIGMVLLYKAGDKQPWLQLGWLCSSTLVVCAIVIGGGSLEWGWVERGSAVCCAFAIIVRLRFGAKIALAGYLAAVFVSSLPMITDYARTPEPQTAWLFITTVFCCLLTIYGAKVRDTTHLLVPIFMLTLNAGIAILCLR